MAVDPIELTLLASRIGAICDEMGAVLKRSAFSPNIKDRLDFSCALFDADGELCAQAAHIPVHLGSMAYAMRGIVSRMDWAPGDMVIVNDPFLGGTHLPDVTLIAPVFVEGECAGFAANRAHHADIGASTPGSMPISRHLDEEGMVIPPSHLIRQGVLDRELTNTLTKGTRDPRAGWGDFSAQVSANRAAMRRLGTLVDGVGKARYRSALSALNDYAERLAVSALRAIPEGRYSFTDWMDDDGFGNVDLPITATLTADQGGVHVDFSGTAAQTEGNVNCPLSVAAAAVYYVFRCLMPPQTPASAGSLRPLTIAAPEGCLLNARRPAAVAAGNVETSTRIVDVIMGALAPALPDRIPAASHGSMNNLAMGSRGEPPWDYYETMGGGAGGGPRGPGMSAIQTHMTNTLNTPIEALEMAYPVRVLRYALRRGSGGRGRHPGGDGLERELVFLAPATVTLITERRRRGPWGLAGGGPGAPGENRVNDTPVGGKATLELAGGDRLSLYTAGGGGWGAADG